MKILLLSAGYLSLFRSMYVGEVSIHDCFRSGIQMTPVLCFPNCDAGKNAMTNSKTLQQGYEREIRTIVNLRFCIANPERELERARYTARKVAVVVIVSINRLKLLTESLKPLIICTILRLP